MRKNRSLAWAGMLGISLSIVACAERAAEPADEASGSAPHALILPIHPLCRKTYADLAQSKALLVADDSLDALAANGKRRLSFQRMLQALLDSAGSSQTPTAFFDTLRASAAQTQQKFTGGGLLVQFDDRVAQSRLIPWTFGADTSHFLADAETVVKPPNFEKWSGTIPVAVVNRTDLRAGDHCGQVRVIYENMVRPPHYPQDIMFSFEFTLPNPHPEWSNFRGCRPYVDFFTGLTAAGKTTEAVALDLEALLFTPLVGGQPVARRQNLDRPGGLRMSLTASGWDMFREFKLNANGSNLSWVVRSLQNVVVDEIFHAGNESAVPGFQQSFLDQQLPLLLGPESRTMRDQVDFINAIATDVNPSHEDFTQMSPEDIGGSLYRARVAGQHPALFASIQAQLPSSVTLDMLVHRTRVMECTGCHRDNQWGNPIKVGTLKGEDVRWPNGEFRHLNSRKAAGGFTVTPAMRDVFLVHRARDLKSILCPWLDVEEAPEHLPQGH